MRLAIDFDHTCFINDWPNIGDMVPGAQEYLQKLKQDGHWLIIWSGRANTKKNDPVGRAKGLQVMRDALVRFGIPFDEIDYGDQGKVLADLYCDDKAVGAPLIMFQGEPAIDWPRVYDLIRLHAMAKRLGEAVGRRRDGWYSR